MKIPAVNAQPGSFLSPVRWGLYRDDAKHCSLRWVIAPKREQYVSYGKCQSVHWDFNCSVICELLARGFFKAENEEISWRATSKEVHSFCYGDSDTSDGVDGPSRTPCGQQHTLVTTTSIIYVRHIPNVVALLARDWSSNLTTFAPMDRTSTMVELLHLSWWWFRECRGVTNSCW